jgi:hypothetical protein
MIPLPDIAVPKAVQKAAGVVRDREADVAAAKQAIEDATRAVTAAIVRDREAAADALDAGRDD